MWAARNGHSHIVRRLCNLKCDPNMKNRFGHTALHEAVVWNHKRCVKELRLGGVNVNIENNVFKTAEDLVYTSGLNKVREGG